jgi:hypothetical protein
MTVSVPGYTVTFQPEPKVTVRALPKTAPDGGPLTGRALEFVLWRLWQSHPDLVEVNL